MTGWIKFKIGDLCNTISETYRGNDEEVVLVNTSDVLDGKILNHERVKNEKLKGQFKKTFLLDDILYSEIRPANRRFAYVDVQDTSFYIASTKLMVLRCNTDIVIPKFLFAILTSQFMIDELQLRAESRSGTFPQITFGAELAPIEVNIPDKDTQLRIVSVLESFQQKIETNNKINRNLAEQIDLLYTTYFENEESREWKTVPLSNLIFFQEGPGIRNWQYVEKEGTKFINIRCINNGDIDVSTANMISNVEANGKYAHFMLKPYDIVMSCSGTLGRYAIVREEHLPLCLNTSVIRFSPAVTESDFSYVYGYMTSKEFQNRQKEMACGSVQANFGPIHLNKMEIHEPPLEFREEYHSTVFPIIQQMICLRRENDKLVKTRDNLLPKLMSGKLDVSELEL